MANFFESDDVTIARVMKDHLNTWPQKPVERILLEDIGKCVPSMMLQQLAASEVKKRYINGSYIGTWSFAVYIRVNAEDTASRLDAVECLEALARWLTERDEQGFYVNLPTIDVKRKVTKIEMPTTPSIAARYEDGNEDYQAIFSLEYKARR